MKITDNLELKLEILHQLLVKESARNVLSNTKFKELLDEKFKGKTLRGDVENLISIDDSQSNDYIELLREIRDYLLES